MKRVVLSVIGVMVLCVHSASQEEIRRLVRGYVEELDKSRDMFHSIEIQEKLNAIDCDVRFSVYFEMLEKKSMTLTP